jgi:hypothetical protein
MVGALPNGSHWLPLIAILNPVLRLNFEETKLSKKLPADARYTGCLRLIAEILRAATQLETMVLCFENAHHFDVDSWRLLQFVESLYSDMAIIVTTRPLLLPDACGDFMFPQTASIETLKGHILLNPLSRDEVSLVCCAI